MTRASTVAIVAVLVLSVLAGAASSQMRIGRKAHKPQRAPAVGVPRVSTPSAAIVPKQSGASFYSYRGAQYKGRDMKTTQYGFVYGLTDKIELGYDSHEIDVDGRTRGNQFDAGGTGFQLKYAMDLLNSNGALFIEFRQSDGRVVEAGARRIPPDADTWTVGAIASRPFGKSGRDTLHLLASASRSEVGNQDAMTWIVGAGLDRPIASGLTAQGDLTAFKETGDVSDFQFAISGGVRYENPTGFFADVNGTLLPSGTPLAGNPLADASVFILDPVFRAEPIVRDFQNDSLGFYTVRVGYTTDF